jgi:hypothetical protein
VPADLRLSWDLFILVFFVIVIAYSFIIGRNSTLKVIIASYMAILTADSLGGVFERYLLPAAPSLQGDAGVEVLILLKIFIFVLVILILTIKGGFNVDILPEKSLITRILSNLTFGFLNAGLALSTVLVYITGGSFFSGGLENTYQTSLYLESEFIQMIVDNYYLWFALPAVAIVVVSLFEPRSE